MRVIPIVGFPGQAADLNVFKGVVVGVCDLRPVAEPSQNKKRNARRQRQKNRRGGNLLEDDVLKGMIGKLLGYLFI